MAGKATNIFKIDKNNQKGRAISLITAVNLSEMKTSNNPAETTGCIFQRRNGFRCKNREYESCHRRRGTNFGTDRCFQYRP